MDSFSIDEVFGIDIDLLGCKLLCDGVQGLSHLPHVVCTIPLLQPGLVLGLLDTVNALFEQIVLLSVARDLQK